MWLHAAIYCVCGLVGGYLSYQWYWVRFGWFREKFFRREAIFSCLGGYFTLATVLFFWLIDWPKPIDEKYRSDRSLRTYDPD